MMVCNSTHAISPNGSPSSPLTGLLTSPTGSDSDDTIVGTSNRGRKLKHKAKSVHEGKLDDGRGVNGYKEVRVGFSSFCAAIWWVTGMKTLKLTARAGHRVLRNTEKDHLSQTQAQQTDCNRFGRRRFARQRCGGQRVGPVGSLRWP
jgi:hypothetical protein